MKNCMKPLVEKQMAVTNDFTLCFTDVCLILNMSWTYIRVYSIYDSYLLCLISTIYYQLLPYVVVEAFSYFSCTFLTSFSRILFYFCCDSKLGLGYNLDKDLSKREEIINW